MNFSVAVPGAATSRDSVPRGRALLDLTIIESDDEPLFLTLFRTRQAKSIVEERTENSGNL
jgi:hypothetical protein